MNLIKTFFLTIFVFTCSSTNLHKNSNSKISEVTPVSKNESNTIGAMSPELIKSTLYAHTPQFRGCYQDGLNANPRLIKRDQITVLLHFEISKEGTVVESNVEGKNATLEMKKCIKSHLDSLVFPKPFGGGKVLVKQPVTLQSLSYWEKNR